MIGILAQFFAVAVLLSPNPAWKPHVAWAADVWNKRCPNMYFVGSPESGGVTFDRVDAVEARGEGIIATYDIKTNHIRFYQGHKDLFHVALVHELGHAAHLGHTITGGYMNAHVGPWLFGKPLYDEDAHWAEMAGYKCVF